MKIKNWLIISLLIGLTMVLSACGFTKYTVSGQIIDPAGNGVFGVTIAYTGPVSGKVTTDREGRWTAVGLKGTTTITPTLKNWEFTPANTTVTSATTEMKFASLQKAYSLTISYQGMGKVQSYPEKEGYKPGDKVTLTIVPEFGWVFSNWAGDMGGAINPITITMDSDRNITATFVQKVAEIIFDDPDLEKVVRNALNKPLGKITKKDVENLTYLNASIQPISSLKGIEHLSALTWLDLSVTGLQTITELSALTNLKYLNLSSNEIVDIAPLAKLVNLEDLNLSKNKISNVSAMAWLVDKKLKYLDLSYNQITDISSLAALTALEKLDLSYNKIVAIKALNKMISLKELNLGGNQIISITPLVDMKPLEKLNLSENKLTNLNDLVWLWSGNLKELNLYGNGVSDLHGVSGLTKLEKLNLGCNVINDLSKLSQLVNLRELYLQDNQLIDLTPIGGLTKVEKLYLHKNKLSTIDPLKTMNGLKEITLMENQLNLTTGKPAWEVIRALRLRGVLVRYDYYQNDAPVITPIEPNPMTVNENELIDFLVIASDPNKDQMTFSAEGELAKYFNSTTHRFTWRPSFDDAGQHSVTFVVSDGEVSSTLTVSFIVLNVNRAPVFKSPTAKQQVLETETLTFKVEASDLDGDVVTISVEGDPALTTRYNSLTQTFTWPTTYSDAGVYLVTFVASDGTDSTSYPVEITVVNKNRPPRFEPPLVNQKVKEMVQLVYTINGVDDDPEDTLTYSMTSPSPKLANVFDPATRTLTWTPTYEDAGTYTVTFKVSDGAGRLEATQTIQITVENVDRPPYFEPSTLIERSVNEYEILAFKVIAYDDDKDTISYSVTGLPPNAKASINPVTGDFLWDTTGYDVGVHNLIFKATANGATTSSTPVKVTVIDQQFYPVFQSIGNKQVNEMERLTFTVKATDKDVYDVLTYSAIGSLSNKFNPETRVFDWTPSYTEAGEYELTFRVTDGLYTVDEKILIKVINVNRLPLVTITNVIPSLQPLETEVFSLTVVASDPDGDPITFSVEGEPIGSFDYISHVFTWTPTYNDAGPHTVVFVVSDWQGSTKVPVTITVQNKDRAPIISAIGPKTVDEYNTLTIPIIATDPDGDVITYSVKPFLPEGATISPTGIFTWKPDYRYVGVNNFMFCATANGVTVETPVTITVNDLFFDPEITNNAGIVNGGTYYGQEMKEIRIIFTASDKDNDELEIQVTGSLADCFTRLKNTNTGVFAWIPDYSSAGFYAMKITVKDSSGRETIFNFNISVANVDRKPILTIPGGLPLELNVGDTLQIPISALDEDGETVTLNVVLLPVGATFTQTVVGSNAEGVFKWTPTTANIVTNPPTKITFRATSNGVSVTQDVLITVKGPKLTITEVAPLNSSIQPGASVKLTATIQNSGNASTKTPFNVKWSIYKNGTLVRDYATNIVNDFLSLGASKLVECIVLQTDVADLSYGTYQMKVTVDEEGNTGGPVSNTLNFSLVPTQRVLTTVVTGGVGTIERNLLSETYDNGSTITLTAKAGDGYMFSHWLGDATGGTNPVNVVMDRDKVVQAVFVKVTLPNQLIFTSKRNTSKGEIFRMDKEGNVYTVFSNPNLSPVNPKWSPDNMKIYFEAYNDTNGRTDIYIINPDGTGLVSLTGNDAATTNTSPMWSPTGNKIAYRSNLAGPTSFEIYARDVSNLSDLTRLSFSNDDDNYPIWTKDGKCVLYSTQSGEIRKANVATGVIVSLNYGTGVVASFTSRITLSPDGKYLAFVSGANIYTITFTGIDDIFSNWDTPRAVTTTGGSNPVWYIDKSKLGFISRKNGTSDIFQTTESGGSYTGRGDFAVCLTNTPENNLSDEIYFRWSPDGSKIVYVSNATNGDYNIYMMNADGTSQVRLTSALGEDMVPQWGP